MDGPEEDEDEGTVYHVKKMNPELLQELLFFENFIVKYLEVFF